jgi:hypothetical protein
LNRLAADVHSIYSDPDPGPEPLPILEDRIWSKMARIRKHWKSVSSTKRICAFVILQQRFNVLFLYAQVVAKAERLAAEAS